MFWLGLGFLGLYTPSRRTCQASRHSLPVLLITVVAPEGPRSKGEGLPTLAQALSGVWEGAWNSGQWNAVNQGRKRVGGEARGR